MAESGRVWRGRPRPRAVNTERNPKVLAISSRCFSDRVAVVARAPSPAEAGEFRPYRSDQKEKATLTSERSRVGVLISKCVHVGADAACPEQRRKVRPRAKRAPHPPSARTGKFPAEATASTGPTSTKTSAPKACSAARPHRQPTLAQTDRCQQKESPPLQRTQGWARQRKIQC